MDLLKNKRETGDSIAAAFQDKEALKREIIAGITAFFTISYIIIVNPMILADAGIPADLSVFATVFVSVIGCLLVGIFADAPLVLTPGMGVNAFFTYTVVVNMGRTWQEAIAVSLCASLIYVIVAMTRLSSLLAKAVPGSLKVGITAGIGLFLVEIGLEKAGLITAGDASILTLGSLQNPETLLALFGLVLSLAFYVRKVPGGFFLGILIISLMNYLLGLPQASMPTVELGNISRYGQLLGAADFSRMASIPFVLAVFSMTMILVFESMGIIEGLLEDQTKFKKTFAVSAITSFLSGFFGTSPTVVAAESAAGIGSGGRTGITALTAGILFALSLFFIPLLSYVPSAAVAPVIIITGAIMMQQLQHIPFDDFSEWFPAFLIIVLIPLTGSISSGLAFGFASYPLLKIFSGRLQGMHPLCYVLALLFILDLVCNTIV